jgi:hypothetical protein
MSKYPGAPEMSLDDLARGSQVSRIVEVEIDGLSIRVGGGWS